MTMSETRPEILKIGVKWLCGVEGRSPHHFWVPERLIQYVSLAEEVIICSHWALTNPRHSSDGYVDRMDGQLCLRESGCS